MRRMHTNNASKEATTQKNLMTVQASHLTKMPFEAFFNLSPLAVSMVLALSTLQVQANPTDGQVVGGQATIKQTSPTRVDINQTSHRAIIDWKSFSIGKNEQVNFNQPNANATILNRVTGNEVSSILGGLTANGKVFLVNPNGIYFGKGAEVNVGSLISSTANISNQNFMNGNLLFDQPGKAGAKIINEGNISITESGIAAFVAPDVRNTGSIIAKLGKVNLAAGAAYSIDLYGDNLINLIVNEATLASLKDTSDTPLKLYVEQAGLIDAQGGYVQLSSATAKQLVDGIINMSGVTQVASVSQQGGKISLNAGNAGVANVTGTLDASSQTNKGGQITVTAQDVNLSSTAKLSSTGTQGGEVLIGGDYQGNGTLANATNTNIAAGAVINAGEHGKVIAWADNRTSFAGEILAKNGFVEVSGKEHLNFDGLVTAKTLLLDPKNIFVQESGDGINKNTTNDDVIGVDRLNILLRMGTNVSLLADDSIYINAEINGKRGAAGGDISLDAKNSIYLNNNILTNNGDVTLKAGNLIRSATNSIIDTSTNTGDLGGDIIITAGNNISLEGIKADKFTVNSTNGNIVLGQPIGANNEENPEVGAVDLQAINGDITLNGINAQGQTTGLGLNVVAGNTITSNQKIAVNQGSLVFGNTNTQSLILKDSIYSREGYSIDIYPTITLAIGETLKTCFANINACSDNTLYANLPKQELLIVTSTISGGNGTSLIDCGNQCDGNQEGPYRILNSQNNTYFVPKIVISNNEKSEAPSPNSGFIKIHKDIVNNKQTEKVLLKLVSFVGTDDKTTINYINKSYDANNSNVLDAYPQLVENIYMANFKIGSDLTIFQDESDLLKAFINELTDSDGLKESFKYVESGTTNYFLDILESVGLSSLANYVNLNEIQITNNDSTKSAYISIGSNDNKVRIESSISENQSVDIPIQQGGSVDKNFSLIKTQIFSGIGQIYSTTGEVFYTNFASELTNNISKLNLVETSLANLNDLKINYALSFYDGFLGQLGSTISSTNGERAVASGSSQTGSTGRSGTNFSSLGPKIGPSISPTPNVDVIPPNPGGGGNQPNPGGGGNQPNSTNGVNQFLNSASQDETSDEETTNLEVSQDENIQVVMGDNMANQADFGRGAGVGATSDVFATKYCVAAPADAGTANQSFFGGCN